MASGLALVTGGNRGLGAVVVEKLLDLGYDVILTARSAEAGKAALDKLKSDKAHFLQLDTSSAESISQAVQVVADKYNQRINLLINNAGIFHPELTAEAYKVTYATNVAGPLLLIEKLSPLLAPGAQIVNVSSELGQLKHHSEELRAKIQAAESIEDLAAIPFVPGQKDLDFNGMKFGAYGQSKAVLNKAEQLLVQQDPVLKQRNLKVINVCPGWCRTDMGSQDAPRSAEEGAESIIYFVRRPEELVVGSFTQDGKVLAW